MTRFEDIDLSKGLLYFGNRLCPFAHRAWWAMHEKGASGCSHSPTLVAKSTHASQA